MSYSHAIVVAVPNSLKFPNKKSTLDADALRKQSEGLIETLREAGVVVSEYCPENGSSVSSLLVGDAAIAIHGTILMCQPKKPGIPPSELRRILPKWCRTIEECPETIDGKSVVLEGGDVFFTGKEIFVGIRKNGTNFEGVKVVARVFCDHAVIPIHMSDKAQSLKYYVSLVAPGILAIGTSKEAQNILKVLEAEAMLRYRIISVDDDDGVNCMLVNNRLIFVQNRAAAKFTALQSNGLELWTVDVSDLLKAGAPLARHCLLIREMKSPKDFFS
ncbi:Amidinotransferase [Necator americanus]|uniref:Amidinotransferase n=1 Tax=Necator americanus TaxID=51031 RepID=W2SHN4_NECAM|nr:Amidinotransferase [Necator americanus]ETN69073.1 Amidinotransferase [Necator americanus]